MIGVSRPMGTTMFMSRRLPLPSPCCRISEPMPISLPLLSIRPPPPPNGWVGGGGEDRVVQHVFPIAGEFLAADHAGLHRMMLPAAGGEHHLVTHLQAIGIAHLEGWQVELAQRLDQAETALLIVGKRVAG